MVGELTVSMQGHRSLAAIVVTDGVEFSARMSADEELTLRLIQRDLDMMAERCRQSGGQVLKNTGDGLLMYFGSAVHAVQCALDIQATLAEAGKALPQEEVLFHRIGIHLGDVFFDGTDAMGNGVNIAARLQTEAAPGGICLSQVTYEVIKTQLHVAVSYAGPLKLKNIKEEVPAYQIAPLQETTQGDLRLLQGQLSPAASRLALKSTIALQRLQQHPENQRIKKLLYNALHNTWENDPILLRRIDWFPLLQQLLQRHPTPEALRHQFKRIVMSLNRTQEYGVLADEILQSLDECFPNPEKARSLATGPVPAAPPPSIYDPVVQIFTHHPQSIRIKKLIYAVCQDVWENHPQRLEALSFEKLVPQLHHKAPSANHLTYQLSRIVRRLNRQSVYQPIVQTIRRGMQSLYQRDDEQTGLQMVSEEGTEGSEGPTQVPAAHGRSGELTQLTEDTEPPVPATHAIASLTSTTHEIAASLSPPATTGNPAPGTGCDRRDLYELRIEIMKYTNPLRAKILLFSSLHGPFVPNHQSWSVLKSQTIEDLLRQMFDYCSSFSDLESKLTILAHCLGNVEEYSQVARVLTAAIRPYYPVPAPRAARVPPHPRPSDGTDPAPDPLSPTLKPASSYGCS